MQRSQCCLCVTAQPANLYLQRQMPGTPCCDYSAVHVHPHWRTEDAEAMLAPGCTYLYRAHIYT